MNMPKIDWREFIPGGHCKLGNDTEGNTYFDDGDNVLVITPSGDTGFGGAADEALHDALIAIGEGAAAIAEAEAAAAAASQG